MQYHGRQDHEDWLHLMKDKPFDEAGSPHYGNDPSLAEWWSALMITETPSDEQDDHSFDPLYEAKERGHVSQVRKPRKVSWEKPSEVDKKYKPRPPPADKASFLDSLQESICAYDPLDSSALQVIENKLLSIDTSPFAKMLAKLELLNEHNTDTDESSIPSGGSDRDVKEKNKTPKVTNGTKTKSSPTPVEAVADPTPKASNWSTQKNDGRQALVTHTEENSLVKGLKEKGLPSTIELDRSRYIVINNILMGNSSITEDSQAKYCHSSSVPEQSSSDASMSCVPTLITKRIEMLRKIKLSKTSSTISSSRASSAGDSFAVVKVIPAASKLGTSQATNMLYLYDYESHFNVYVAYFRRSEVPSECLRLYQQPTPVVFPTLKSEVVIKVEVSTVSATDCMVRRGQWWGEHSVNPLNLPIIPGVTFSGYITQIDSGAARTGLNKGDRVLSLVRLGANSRHLCIAADRLVKIPREVRDPSAAACLPEIYLTAFQVLHYGQKNAARYRKTSLTGKSILVLGGATALGRAMIEVALAGGSGVVYATGKGKQMDEIGKVGGSPLSREPSHWMSLLRGKIDIVVAMDEPYGRAELQFEHTNTLNQSGMVILVGGPGIQDADKTVSLDEGSERLSRKLHHFNIFDSWESDIKRSKRDLTHLLKLLSDGLLKPNILDRIALSEVVAAHEFLESTRLSGFMLCEPWLVEKKPQGELPVAAPTTMSTSDAK